MDEKLLSGSAFDQLVTAAAKAKGRLIVVGAVGHGLARRAFLGSVAERTAEGSPIPTLVVRSGGRLNPWIRGKRALKVLVGYDFSATGDAALGWANQLKEIGKAQITVIYRNWPPDKARRLGYEGPLPFVANPDDVQKNLERDLNKRIATLLPNQKVTTIVEPGWGTPEGYLFEMASRQKCRSDRRRNSPAEGRVAYSWDRCRELCCIMQRWQWPLFLRLKVLSNKDDNKIIQPKSPHSG